MEKWNATTFWFSKCKNPTVDFLCHWTRQSGHCTDILSSFVCPHKHGEQFWIEREWRSLFRCKTSSYVRVLWMTLHSSTPFVPVFCRDDTDHAGHQSHHDVPGEFISNGVSSFINHEREIHPHLRTYCIYYLDVMTWHRNDTLQRQDHSYPFWYSNQNRWR